MNKVKLFVMALIFSISSVSYADFGGNVLGSIGFRALDDDGFWEPVEDQLLIGVIADFSLGNTAPLFASVALQSSADIYDAGFNDLTGSVADLTVGLKLMPRSGVVRPYFAAGFASVSAELDNDITDDDDHAIGHYINAGLLVRVTKGMSLGFDLRLIEGTDMTLFGVETDADSFVGAMVIGYSWGDE